MTQQVPNKLIDNASGQVVRLDIENTIKAVMFIELIVII